MYNVLLLCFTGYLLVHLALYAMVFRRLSAFMREGVIFRYHAIPAVLLTVVAITSAVAMPTSDGVALAIFMVALQGLYSLSFLELWALSAGSYSLRLLQRVGTDGPSADLSDLEQLGAGKQQARFASLRQLGLLSREMHLTRRGQRVASVLNGLVRMLHLRPEE
jgi:hypothetical protein